MPGDAEIQEFASAGKEARYSPASRRGESLPADESFEGGKNGVNRLRRFLRFVDNTHQAFANSPENAVRTKVLSGISGMEGPGCTASKQLRSFAAREDGHDLPSHLP